MPRLIAVVLAVLVLILAAVYLSGADRVIEIWARDGTRTAQDAIARALRALRAGDPAALSGFLAVCFSYGFFHAAGPGHGKLLIGGYGAARAVGAAKLSAVALASSLAQGATAVALVAAGLWVWRLGRAQMTDLADRLFAPLSFAAIALVGLWLVWRGIATLRQQAGRARDMAADHSHQPRGDDGRCAGCDHVHGPDAAAVAQATGWRDMAVLIGAVAIRPCTGALFVLIVTAQMGLFAIGVAGTIAMALGTASVTVAVALMAVTMRRGMVAGLPGAGAVARAQPVIEIAVGLLVAVLGARLALGTL